MTTAPHITPTDVDHKRARMIEQVAQTRRRLRCNGVWTGGALLALAMSLWLGLAVVLDMLLVLPVPARIVAGAGLWAIAACGAGLTLWPALRPLSLQRVAFAIERALGRMHNRLVTVLDLPTTAAPAHATWTVERLVERTSRRMRDYEPRLVADSRPATRLSVVAAASVLALLALTAFMPAQMSAAMSRLVWPTQPIAPPTWLHFDIEPGEAAVLHGEAVTFEATLTRGALDADQAVALRLTDDQGRSVRYPMREVDEGRYRFDIESLERSYHYRIETGRTWLGPYRLERIDRPRVTGVEARVQLPDYMHRDEPVDVIDPTDQIHAVQGATVELAAEIHGHVDRAVIELLEPRDERVVRTELEQRTWFDDHLPADAELIGQWRWIDEPVRSGRRAHTFRWDRTAYGFRTRLNPLTLQSDESLYIFAHLDPSDPPDSLTITLETTDGIEHAFAWGQSEGDAPDSATHLGELPETGEWTRLAIAADRISDADTIALGSIRFDIDAGSITFDRAGAMREVTRERTLRTYERIDALPMRPTSEGDTTWRGRVTVEGSDRWYRLHAVNDHGHSNEPMQPVPILATRDRPPELVIEQPGRHVTLTEPRPVPLVIRASDDYGLASIALEFASTREALTDEPAPDTNVTRAPLWSRDTSSTTPPPTSRAVARSLTLQRFDLSPGSGVYYRAVAVDTLGQRTFSRTYRFAHEPASGPTKPAPTSDTAVEGMLEELGELAALDEAAIEVMDELVGALPEGVALDLERSRATLVDADGQPLGPEALAEALDAWRRALEETSSDDTTSWQALRERFRERQQRLAGLAERMTEAADQGRDEMTLLPVEPEVLEALAREAQRLAERHPLLGTDEPEAWELPRLADFQARRDAERAELAMLEAELSELLAARGAAAEEFGAGQRQLAESLQRMQTRHQGAAQLQRMQAAQAQALDEQQRIEALRRQIEQLRSEAKLAEVSVLDELSEEQAAREAEMLAALEEARGMLEAAEAWDDDLFQLPDAPWAPPGEQRERVPTEGDEADLGAAEQGAEGADDALAGSRDAMAERGAWWDEPLEGLEDPTRWTIDERYADRHAEQAALQAQEARDDASGQGDDGESAMGPPTPRQMMLQRQSSLAGTLDVLQERFDALHAETGAARTDLAAALRSQDVEAIERALSTPGAMRALAMAGLMPQAAAAGDDTGAGAGRAMVMPVMVTETETHEPASSRHSAAFYRLPPELREPLREAMREQGPPAYRTLIERYYRRLSRSVEE